MVTCYIALGSNVGNRNKNIDLALKHLKADPAIEVVKVSSLLKSEPHNCPPQPKFLNGVVKLKTAYSAQDLLKRLQAIEAKLGRKPPHPKNQPRTIDLDILLYGDAEIDEANLQIPHPRLWEREFVTLPLKEVAPEMFKKVNICR